MGNAIGWWKYAVMVIREEQYRLSKASNWRKRLTVAYINLYKKKQTLVIPNH